ncbi:MAG TPA: biotin/lipoyl-binding protein [Phaeodactylibacter sp.]|nr:biotin/lipoyl-binding protein [Phaeodactylibacter sp.]
MKKNEYKISVNDAPAFDFDAEQMNDFDFVKEQDGHFHILKNNKAYRAEVVATDFANKTFTIKINGTPHKIKIEDHYDQLVKQLGLSVASTQKVGDVKAPMPGLVLDVSVEVGQEVKKGDGLLILEAMKMENVIKSIGEGIVKSIHIEQGKAVEKGQLLIEME